jgi:hypothetical protein
MTYFKRIFSGLLLVWINGLPALSQAPHSSGYLIRDGAWCWFSDPRAILVKGKVYTGWVKKDGTIEAAVFDPGKGAVAAQPLNPKLDKDDHANPAFVATRNGKVLATYTKHGSDAVYVHAATLGAGALDYGEALLVDPHDEEELKKFPRRVITYANPFQLKKENGRIYCFGRWTGFKPNVMWSDDHGESWSKSKVMITNYPFDANNRPYVKYSSDGRSRIHILFTDGHPRNEPANSVYYAYYENGAFYRADGSRIAGMDQLPFTPKEATVVYRATEQEGRAWIADIGQDQQDRPVILYTKSPEETDHRYVYARFDGKQWQHTELCQAGKWFPQTPEGQTEREPHYFGGMSLHPGNPNVVYVSREIDGVFEIERLETPDGGKTWQTEPITQRSAHDNVRPYLPRGLKAGQPEIVFWMENAKYVHYTDYDTAVRYGVWRKE